MTELALDTLIRLATEKAHAMGMRIDLVAHAPDETPEPNLQQQAADTTTPTPNP